MELTYQEVYHMNPIQARKRIVHIYQQTQNYCEMLCCDDTQSDRRPPLKAHHTHQTSTTTQQLRCKLSTTPCANTSRRAKRNPRLRTPSPNLRLITEITVSTCQR
jgi:hypothetical protein